MVTDSPNQGAVGDRDLVDVRRIDDEFTPIGHHRFELVHAFAAHPKFIVHQRRAREHGVERMLLVGNVKRPRQIARLIPGVLR